MTASANSGSTAAMSAQIANVTFDCHDVLKVAAFWLAVLGRPLDKGSSELFATIGGADATRREPALYFNKVPDPEGNEFCIAATAFTG